MKYRDCLSFSPVSAALLLWVILANCSGEVLMEHDPAPRQVTVVIPETVMIAPSVSGYGTLSVESKLDIRAPVEGRIIDVHLREGDRVEKGDLLVSLENDQLRIRRRQTEAAVMSAEAALSLAGAREREGQLQAEIRILQVKKGRLLLELEETELEQLGRTLRNKEDLFSMGGISEEAFTAVKMAYYRKETEYLNSEIDLAMQIIGYRDRDIIDAGFDIPETEGEKHDLLTYINTETERAEAAVARSNLRSAEAEKEAVEYLISQLRCVSSLSGVVAGSSFEPGEQVERGDLLMTVFSEEVLAAPFQLTGQELSMVEPGMPVTIHLERYRDESVAGTIYQVAPFIDPKSGMGLVKARIANPELDMKPGLYFTIQVQTGIPEEEVTLVKSAIRETEKDSGVVYVLRQNRVFPRVVRLGKDLGDTRVISEGLKAGEGVVDRPMPDVREGELVSCRQMPRKDGDEPAADQGPGNPEGGEGVLF